MGERETYVVMASMWSRSRSALARRFATILLGALCMYRIRIARSLLFFSFRFPASEVFESLRENFYRRSQGEVSSSLSLERESFLLVPPLTCPTPSAKTSTKRKCDALLPFYDAASVTSPVSPLSCSHYQ